jgi:hypothetical protein
MTLDTKEVAGYLIGQVEWSREGIRRPAFLEYLDVSFITKGREDLIKEMLRLLPSMKVYRNGSYPHCSSDILLEVHVDERKQCQWTDPKKYAEWQLTTQRRNRIRDQER